MEITTPDLFKVIDPRAWFFLTVISVFSIGFILRWIGARLVKVFEAYGTRLDAVERVQIVHEEKLKTHKEDIEGLQEWRHEHHIVKPAKTR
jgi:hypothetical protein